MCSRKPTSNMFYGGCSKHFRSFGICAARTCGGWQGKLSALMCKGASSTGCGAAKGVGGQQGTEGGSVGFSTQSCTQESLPVQGGPWGWAGERGRWRRAVDGRRDVEVKGAGGLAASFNRRVCSRRRGGAPRANVSQTNLSGRTARGRGPEGRGARGAARSPAGARAGLGGRGATRGWVYTEGRTGATQAAGVGGNVRRGRHQRTPRRATEGADAWEGNGLGAHGGQGRQVEAEGGHETR